MRVFIKPTAGDTNCRLNLSAFPEDSGEMSFEVATDNSTGTATVETIVVEVIDQEVM